MKYSHLDTPIGRLLLAADSEGLHAIRFPSDGEPARAPDDWTEDASALAEVARQLRAYFSGELETFDLILAPQATPFQAEVLKQLIHIPFGQTRSYGELAQALQRPGAARAVGTACARNPLPIVIPCHRVIGQRGALTGFAGGLTSKRWLLDHESRPLKMP